MKAKRVWGLVLAAAMCMAVAGCGQKEAETASTEPQYQVIGTEAEGAYDILLKNSIGQDVTGISVKISEEEEYPANMLASDAVLKNGETAEWFYMPEEAAETEGVGEKDVALNVVYQVQITLADSTVYELSALGLDDIDKNAELCLEDDVVFAKYTSKASGDAVSTKEQEVAATAQKDAESQEAVTSEPAPVEEVQQEAPAQQSAPAASEPQQAPAEQIPQQTTEGCFTEGGGPAFN